MKTNLEPWKSNLEPWKTIKTNLNHWKPIKTEMEPWKTNLEPSKLTWSCRGWLWGVQVVTGDSQEEVIIFRDKQTHMHHNIYVILILCVGTFATYSFLAQGHFINGTRHGAGQTVWRWTILGLFCSFVFSSVFFDHYFHWAGCFYCFYG